MKNVQWIGVVLMTGALGIGCASEEDGADGNGTFPNFYAMTKDTAPSLSSSFMAKLMGTIQGSQPGNQLRSANVGVSATFGSTLSTSATDFATAFDTSQNYIGQVFNDPGPEGPVKSMYVLLAQVQADLNDINSNYSDDDGEATNCTKIAAGTEVTTPFFATATNAAFNAWDEDGKYLCYDGDESEGFMAFGRHAVEDAASDCDDAFEYYVVQGGSSDDSPNTEQTDVRGTTVDGAGVKKFYYNGCSGELKMAYAQTTRYAAGVEFSSRTELTGNVNDHTFAIRTHYIDADSTYANHITMLGKGQSQAGSDGTTGYFVMGYRSDNCGTASNSATCTAGTAASFCVGNSGSADNYSLSTNGTDCSSLTTDYAAMTALERSDLPSGYFEVSPESFGF